MLYMTYVCKNTQTFKELRTKKGMLKPYYHVLLDQEFKLDCEIWKTFLLHYRDLSLCRPMIDLTGEITAKVLNFSSDASRNPELGMGAVFENRWFSVQWELGYIKNFGPSIEYLQLLAVVTAVLTWGCTLRNIRLVLFCDNTAVVNMINNGFVSSCKNCMYLLRLITLNNLVNNRRIFTRYVKSADNELSDSLSRLQYKRFWRLAKGHMNPEPSEPSPLVWPASKIWVA